MPYAPNVSYQGDKYIAAAGSSLANDISTWLKESRDEQKQKEFNVGAATQLQRAGQLSPEELQSFLKLNTDKQGGFLASFARTQSEKMQERQLGMEQQRITQTGRIADMGDSRSAAEMDNRLAVAKIGADSRVDVAGLRRGANGQPIGDQVMTRDGRPITGHYLVGNTIVTDQQEVQAAAADNWKKFNTDVKNATGATYGEWQNATNKKLDPVTGDFVADFPEKIYPPDPATGFKGSTIPGTTRRISGDLYQQLMTRGKTLESGAASADVQASGGSAQKVRVKSPDGKIGFIPAGQLEAAKAQGYQAL